MAKHSFTHIERDVQESMEWFFGYSDSAIGMRSNFPDMVHVQSKLTEDKIHSHMIGLLDAIDKKRKIQKIYFSLSQPHQNCLYAIYGWQTLNTFAPELKNVFGPLTPLVAHLHPNVSKEKSNHLKWLEEARQLYREAVIAFYTANKKRNK